MRRRFKATRSPFAVCAGVAAFCLAIGFAISTDAAGFLRRFHHWGRFRPGSWVVVRQGSETLDAAGRVVDAVTSETRTTLAGVDDKTLVLRVSASLEVGGKRLDGRPQELRQGLLGEQPAAANHVDLGEQDLTIAGRSYRCHVEQTEVALEGRRQIIKTWFAPNVAPYVLRRQTTTIDAATGKKLSETTMDVVSLAVERRILARSRNVAEIRVVERHPGGQSTTRGYCCPEIPGGVVSQTTEEYDTTGKLLRRSKTELIDFETK